jgi:hypothetical protein
VGIPQLKELLLKKKKFREARRFKGKLVCWICSKNELITTGQEFCRKNDIYFSSARQVEQLMQHLRESSTSG